MSFYNKSNELFIQSLDELNGTTSGSIILPVMVSSRFVTEYNIDNLDDISDLYSDIINYGFSKEHIHIMNKEVLLLLWSTLNISSERRIAWENKFPILTVSSGLTSILR